MIMEWENGEVISAFMNAYMSNGMEQQNAETGDLVLIQLLGKARSQHSNSYNQFQLYIEKST